MARKTGHTHVSPLVESLADRILPLVASPRIFNLDDLFGDNLGDTPDDATRSIAVSTKDGNARDPDLTSANEPSLRDISAPEVEAPARPTVMRGSVTNPKGGYAVIQFLRPEFCGGELVLR